MKTRFLSTLLILGMALIQGCKLERLELPCPTALRIEPTAAHAGETVTIVGRDFSVNAPHLYTVTIGNTLIEVMDVPDSNTLRFKVPSGVGNGPVSLSLAGGTSCNANQDIEFTYYYTATMVRDLTDKLLEGPRGLDLNKSGKLVVADPGNFKIRIIDTATGEIVSSIGSGNGGCDSLNAGLDVALFLNPFDVEVDQSNNTWIPESGSMVVRWIDAGFAEAVQVYAGKCGEYNASVAEEGPRKDVRLFYPKSVAYDDIDKVLYFIDAYGVRKIEDDQVSLYTPMPSNADFEGIAISRSRKNSGPVFISDHGAPGTVPPTIKSINDLGQSEVIKYASDVYTLNSPRGLATDNTGNIFIVDIGLNSIFVLYKNGALELLAGQPGEDGHIDDVPGLQAQFNFPDGIALNEKDGKLISVYISDSGNNAVRTITIE